MSRYTTSAVEYARAALARGPLVEVHVEGAIFPAHYRFGRRLFNLATVTKLVAAGEAAFVGNTVVAL